LTQLLADARREAGSGGCIASLILSSTSAFRESIPLLTEDVGRNLGEGKLLTVDVISRSRRFSLGTKP
jgi:hypothetical protein